MDDRFVDRLGRRSVWFGGRLSFGLLLGRKLRGCSNFPSRLYFWDTSGASGSEVEDVVIVEEVKLNVWHLDSITN